jgi:hypothetical protein
MEQAQLLVNIVNRMVVGMVFLLPIALNVQKYINSPGGMVFGMEFTAAKIIFIRVQTIMITLLPIHI